MAIKIDNENLSLIIPSEIDGRNARVIIPQPTKIAMESIAPLLACIFTKIQQGISPDIIVVDYELYIKESNQDTNGAKAFVERLLSGAEVQFFDGAYELKNLSEFKIDEDTLSNLEGLLLFFSAILRYGGKIGKKEILVTFLLSRTDLAKQVSSAKSRADTKAGAQKKAKK